MTALSLFAPRRLWLLISSDALNVARDPILVVAAVMSLLPALLLHYTKTSMDEAALAAFSIVEISRYVVPVALMIPPALIGWVTGFLLLEDRDEGTLLALDVTPVGKSGFLLYRVSITAVLALAITFYAWPLIMPETPIATVLCLAALVAANAVAFAIVLPAIARNKVEGLAVTKITNLLSLASLLAAIPSPLRFLAAPLPPYWAGELLNLTNVAPLPLWLTASLALLVNAAALLGLFALFARRAG